MRKILMTTTAALASTIAFSAAQAAEPTMTVSGAINYQYTTESSDTSGVAGVDQFQMGNSSTQLHFDVDAEADNGLVYGGRVDWRPASNGIDEIWIDIQGSFGTLILGNDDGAVDQVPGAVDVLVGSFGYDGDYAGGENSQQGSASVGFGSNFNTDDNSKIVYYTPSFGGFTGGFSHTPDDNNGGTEAVSELSAAWGGDLGGASLDLGAGYLFGSSTQGTEDISAYRVGAVLGVGDFSFGASYVDDGDSGIAKGSRATAGSGGNIAVGYNFGTGAVSAGYLATEVDDATGTVDEFDNLHFDVEYYLAEGLTTYAGVQFTESTDGSANLSDESTTVIIGAALAF